MTIYTDRYTSPSVDLYNRLSSTEVIQVVEADVPFFGKIPFLEGNRFEIVKGHNKRLATGGVASCFAICLRGFDASKTPILGLCHTDSSRIEQLLQKLRTQMQLNGAEQETIEIFVVGGAEPTENANGVLFEETEFVRLAEKMNIKELKFNLMEGETDALDVVLTAKKIYVSKLELFDCFNSRYQVGRTY